MPKKRPCSSAQMVLVILGRLGEAILVLSNAEVGVTLTRPTSGEVTGSSPRMMRNNNHVHSSITFVVKEERNGEMGQEL